MTPTPYMMRAATLDDVETVALMGARFFEEAGWADVTTWDHPSICATLRSMIEQESGIVLVVRHHGDIVGMAGGLVYPAYYNAHHLTGQEMFWWVEPDHRAGVGLMLLDALEDQAMMRGAQSWSMIALDKLRPEAIGAIYQRRGYRPSERTFIKSLETADGD
jgi:GNAT superfamily N-acetyltransferase